MLERLLDAAAVRRREFDVVLPLVQGAGADLVAVAGDVVVRDERVAAVPDLVLVATQSRVDRVVVRPVVGLDALGLVRITLVVRVEHERVHIPTDPGAVLALGNLEVGVHGGTPVTSSLHCSLHSSLLGGQRDPWRR